MINTTPCYVSPCWAMFGRVDALLLFLCGSMTICVTLLQFGRIRLFRTKVTISVVSNDCFRVMWRTLFYPCVKPVLCYVMTAISVKCYLACSYDICACQLSWLVFAFVFLCFNG